MHLRIGGMETEKVLSRKKTGKNGCLMDVIGGLRCISKLGECGLSERAAACCWADAFREARSDALGFTHN